MDYPNANTTLNNDSAYSLLSQNIEQIALRVTDLSKHLQKYGTQNDNSKLRETVQRLTTDIRQKITETSRSLAELNDVRFSPYLSSTNKTRRDKLAKDLQTYVERFTSLCSRLQEAQIIYPLPALNSENHSNNLSQPHPLYGQEDDDERQSLLFKEIRYIDKEREFNALMDQERDADITHIHRELQAVNEITRDLKLLVDEQGLEIDNIERHVSDASSNTDFGVQELRKASSSQKSERSKMLWIFLVIVIIVAVITIVVVISAACSTCNNSKCIDDPPYHTN